MVSIEPLTLDVDAATHVSALLQRPDDATSVLVLAHGAGAGMRHAFMADFADGLAARGVATLRYQFPFMERGSRRTFRAVAHATVRSDVSKREASGAAFSPAAVGRRRIRPGRPIERCRVRGLVSWLPLHPAESPAPPAPTPVAS